jgi:chorismate lyase/3-hydroxybenzoate synthase
MQPAMDAAKPPLSALRVQLIQPRAAAAALADAKLLALICFGVARPALADPRAGWVPLAAIDRSAPPCEAWYGSGPVESAADADLTCAFDGSLLFGHLHLDEAACGGLEAATRFAYERIFACLRSEGYPHLLRIWHFFPDIASTDGGLDRYQVFCRGRFAALAGALSEFEPCLPAASALGSRVPGLAIQFVAARRPGLQIENPRQISAFHYPPQYGPRSPSFSRSMLMPGDTGAEPLLISGTASIVGHRTCHPGDGAAQLAETMRNLDTLLEAAAARRRQPMRIAALRAYLRHPTDAGAVRAAIARRFTAEPTLALLEADICRRDLLLELEAVAHPANP